VSQSAPFSEGCFALDGADSSLKALSDYPGPPLHAVALAVTAHLTALQNGGALFVDADRKPTDSKNRIIARR
jgi:hypothetical protein